MQQFDFPVCCGAKVLARFGYDSETSFTKEQVNRYLNDKEKEHKGQIGFLTAVLNSVEETAFSSVFDERGWQRVANGIKNPRTGHYLYMYIFKCTTAADHPTKVKKIISSNVTTSPTTTIKRKTSILGRGSILRKKRNYDW